jgi:hypothetical protein
MATETSPAAASRTAFAGFDLGDDLAPAAEAPPGGRLRIRRVGVVGAGTMGSGIAALAASAGLPVVLLDIPAEGADRGAIPKGACSAPSRPSRRRSWTPRAPPTSAPATPRTTSRCWPTATS